jgi:hypothetical protein
VSGPPDDEGPLPRVTPSLLAAAPTMCPRRLDAEYQGRSGSGDYLGRARLREPFIDAARVAHAEGGAPRLDAFAAPVDLEPEEQRVFAHAAGWYSRLYGDRAVTTHLHDCERPTESPARGVRVGGWVDLTVVGDDGTKELRQLELWAGRRPLGDDPLDLPAVRLAVLRLARWFGDDPVLVSWADLVRGDRRERAVDLGSELPALRERFEHDLDELRQRISDPTVVRPGEDCRQCRHVWRCPAHEGGVNVSTRRGDIRPGIITLTPTAFESWTRCGRAWRDQYLLSVPASDETGSPDHGQLVHDLLRLVHQRGSCHDAGNLRDVLDGHGADDRLRGEVERHARRCPSPADALGHELDLARFHGQPFPAFMAAARFDAVWVHDEMLDARDYKTGRVWHSRVADDPRALVQAWVLAKVAAERGLRLRLRYEHLATEADDDPDPWEPDVDELADVEHRLHEAVRAMHTEEQWRGVADEEVCRHCRYRSICPDSASPSEPLWPACDDLDDADADAFAR